MNDAIGKHFGLLIAFVLPGFLTVWAARPLSPEIEAWLNPSPTIPGGIESVFFVTLASITAGMMVSALRWATVDTLHHHTGISRPTWDDANLPPRIQAFDTVVEAHYRFYQFYANAAVALALLYSAQWLNIPGPSARATVAFVALEVLFLAASRDNLRRYYGRTARLLGVLPPAKGSVSHDERQPSEAVSAAGQAAEGDNEGHDHVHKQVDRS